MNDGEFRDLIDRIRERTDIVQVIGARLALNRHHKALCPFHREKTPSFSVNPRGQYFHCFGCGVGGDVFRFLEQYERKSFLEVVSELATQAGIPLPVSTSEDRQRLQDRRTMEDILTETARFYHQSLIPEVRDYLTNERGFSEETIARFQIGYANGHLREHLIEACRFPVDLCLKAGVLTQSDGARVRDYFSHRVIFPNLKRGRVVHLSGRNLDGRAPKYLHLPGEIRHLYNEDALTNPVVYLTEGIPDCLSAVQLDYPAVAILGSSHFKPEYLPKFSRCETIYLCLDGDRAGEEGALRIGGLIGERARIVQLPKGLDLNEYLTSHSREEFEALIASAQDIITYELSLIPPDTAKTALPQRLEPILRTLARMEQVTAEAYLGEAIKPRFRLKTADLKGYRELVRKYRREEAAAAPTIHTASATPEPVYTARFEGLVDLVEHHGSPAFLVKDGSTLAILSQVQRDGVRYIPPPREHIPWLLPRGEEVLQLYNLQEGLSQKERDEALYDALWSYHQSISELPGEEYYDLLVAWDFHTYLVEAVQYSPIICLFAVPERGKSRTGKGMIHVAYRGIHVESLRDAYLVRVAQNFQASLFFDVKDIWNKAEANGSEDILLHRFEKGAKVPRVLFPERGPYQDTVYYSVFGPTVIGTNEGVHRILETRAVQINMPETSKRFENDVTPEGSLPFKERLIAFRAAHLGETFADIPKPAAGRLGDILKPLQQMIRLVKPEREPSLLKLVKELEAKKLIEQADSLEAQILMTIIGLKGRVERGVLPVRVITDTFNEGKSEKCQITYQRAGKRLAAMGFQKASTGNGASAIIWDEDRIDRMAERYGLRETSETSETSELVVTI